MKTGSPLAALPEGGLALDPNASVQSTEPHRTAQHSGSSPGERNGCTEDVMLAHGFTIELMGGLGPRTHKSPRPRLLSGKPDIEPTVPK